VTDPPSIEAGQASANLNANNGAFSSNRGEWSNGSNHHQLNHSSARHNATDTNQNGQINQQNVLGNAQGTNMMGVHPYVVPMNSTIITTFVTNITSYSYPFPPMVSPTDNSDSNDKAKKSFRTLPVFETHSLEDDESSELGTRKVDKKKKEKSDEGGLDYNGPSTELVDDILESSEIVDDESSNSIERVDDILDYSDYFVNYVSSGQIKKPKTKEESNDYANTNDEDSESKEATTVQPTLNTTFKIDDDDDNNSSSNNNNNNNNNNNSNNKSSKTKSKKGYRSTLQQYPQQSNGPSNNRQPPDYETDSSAVYRCRCLDNFKKIRNTIVIDLPIFVIQKYANVDINNPQTFNVGVMSERRCRYRKQIC
jgi:hypothetical protein